LSHIQTSSNAHVTHTFTHSWITTVNIRLILAFLQSLLKMIIEVVLLLVSLPLIEQSIYLLNSADHSSVQFYDCLIQNNLFYCRRPIHPIDLKRDQEVRDCYHNGIKHSFNVLEQQNISVSTILHEWKSSVEMAEQYAHYLRQQQRTRSANGLEKFLCQCIDPQSFGKYCEYRLVIGNTFEETLDWLLEMRNDYEWRMQLYGDIVCYTTLECDSGLLCLDWRDICDGTQHCMFGYDEENCDKLEFNECEHDEYRCMNGMCIPDQYFLDGDYDCMDMSDEKGKFNDQDCAFEETTHTCDDRMCLRWEWSCGDGQCTEDRTNFLSSRSYRVECESLRDQYHICELHYKRRQWTLPNGRCFFSPSYEEDLVNRSASEECLYLLKCSLSDGVERNCPCESYSSCIHRLMDQCNSTTNQYPTGAILAPYAFHFYSLERGFSRPSIILNGTIKCRGYMAENFTLESSPTFQFFFEYQICSSLESPSVGNVGFDRFCHNDSHTFNNRSYKFIDVCRQSKECISAYRINDERLDCADKGDIDSNDSLWTSWTNVQDRCLRCSKNEPTCVSVIVLGDGSRNCKSYHDELWMGEGRSLSTLACDKRSKDDCQLIRQYIERSWKIDTNFENSTRRSIIDRIPFRQLCDTFWQMDSRQDEDVGMCQEYWTCLEDQWRCRTGQCIKVEWVLDGEWDCSDASDEEAIFFAHNAFSMRNLKLRNETFLHDHFDRWYTTRPFGDICNLSSEYPCYRVDAFDPLNLTQYRPCVNLTQIGDCHVDCVGALDERNNRQHCYLSSMLGYSFECSDGNGCDFYTYACNRDPPCKDSRIRCHGSSKSPDCSDSFDFMCSNGTCAKQGRCDQQANCLHGEDEYMCILIKYPLSTGGISSVEAYRLSKKLQLEEKQTMLDLPPALSKTDTTHIPPINITVSPTQFTTNHYRSKSYPSSVPFWCNRGVAVLLFTGSIVCLCPPQYYGDNCQYHSDRLTVLVHLNLSQSIYDEFTNPATLLKLLIILLHKDETVMIESFQVRPSIEMTSIKKAIHSLLYSRSNDSMMKKRTRYFNRSMIIDDHPYSVRIEAYELQMNDQKPRLVGVWLYPIYFDFLPNHRLAKVLHLTTLDDSQDPCLSNLCGNHQVCHRLLNEPSRAVCLCQTNFGGKECSIEDRLCQDDYCRSNGLCKPNYRSFVRENDRLPYCLCPLNRLGDRCQMNYDRCDRNPCLNNGTCLPTSQLNSYFCLCTKEYYGNECQLKKHAVHLWIKERVNERVALVQYFDINFVTLDLIFVHQHLYDSLPQILFYLQEQTKKSPAVAVVKLYSNTQVDTYLISLQIDIESINVTTEVTERTRCPYVNVLLTNQTGLFITEYENALDDVFVFRNISHSKPSCVSSEHKIDVFCG
jgi:hypothetical protein